ncbi:hypothetical protein FN846DRAFT_83967 [Sphaerosporella brunnea]|uniref:Uncharacterized protein n=1 Tax=Sphaerosporella brunnea TaxID=1250544 RepID=A0A5J5EST9_9PEZI|nr:hypothetical protein FN846DRAFT_83967 [Sphaerosporella brunnea]
MSHPPVRLPAWDLNHFHMYEIKTEFQSGAAARDARVCAGQVACWTCVQRRNAAQRWVGLESLSPPWNSNNSALTHHSRKRRRQQRGRCRQAKKRNERDTSGSMTDAPPPPQPSEDGESRTQCGCVLKERKTNPESRTLKTPSENGSFASTRTLSPPHMNEPAAIELSVDKKKNKGSRRQRKRFSVSVSFLSFLSFLVDCC